jgi:hypothetical protein
MIMTGKRVEGQLCECEKTEFVRALEKLQTECCGSHHPLFDKQMRQNESPRTQKKRRVDAQPCRPREARNKKVSSTGLGIARSQK